MTESSTQEALDIKARPQDPHARYLTFCTTCNCTLVRLAFGRLGTETWWHVRHVDVEPISLDDVKYRDVCFSRTCLHLVEEDTE